MRTTQLKYMEDQFLYEDTAQVQDVRTQEDGRVVIILDRTIFYPQGGGQPYDQGHIRCANGQAHIEDVRFIDGYVHHIGLIDGHITTGQEVSLHVNVDRRRLHARLHTAGHLMDESIHNLGYAWHPIKSNHFPGKCAVEYEGSLDGTIDYVGEIQQETNKLLEAGYDVRADIVSKDQLESVCRFVMPNMPADKPTRIVYTWGDKAVPCGGTHVQNIRDIGTITICKVKAKKGIIKVTYDVS